MKNKDTVIDFLLKNLPIKLRMNVAEIQRCIEKSTNIIYDGNNCIVASDDVVFYLISNGTSNDKRRFIVKNRRKHLIGKIAYLYGNKTKLNKVFEVISVLDDGRIKVRIK